MEIKSKLSEKAQIDLKYVEAAMQGDEKAFQVLHDRYKKTIYYLVLRMVNNPSDAEDLTIEALGKAFRNIHQYVPRYAFSSWLFKIATNNCIDFIRRKKMSIIDYDSNSEQSFDSLSATALAASQAPDPEEKLIKQQSLERIREIVARLRPQYQKLVELRYFQEYTYDEISIELDLPMGTVKAQLFRAREMLQNILKDLDNPEA